MKEFRVKDTDNTFVKITQLANNWKRITLHYKDLATNLADLAQRNFENVVTLELNEISHVVNGHVLRRAFSIQIRPVYKRDSLYGLISLAVPEERKENKLLDLFVLDEQGDLFSPDLERIADQDDEHAELKLLMSLTLEVLEL